jgi:indole-3-glycerol phosphate synthase / phosphoribosylanthranilate isomerase
MRVKICGLRRASDAAAAIALGATHLGVVLAEDSPRCATTQEARAIARLAHGVVPMVLVFRKQGTDVIQALCDAVGSPRVQVHGASPEQRLELQLAGLVPMQVVQVAATASRLPELQPPPCQREPALFDGGSGGSGQSFCWDLLGTLAPVGVFVAGGIRPDNLGRLLRHQPWGIDVSSGIEGEPGVKDLVLMSQLFQAIRLAGEMQ